MPADAVATVRERAHRRRARARSSRTHHDVIAFTESIAEQVGEAARWFHYGLTSSDVVDTGLALQLRDAGALLLAGSTARWRRCAPRARAPRHALHRPHARRPRRADDDGLKLLGWACELRRHRERLSARARRRHRQDLRRGRHLRQHRPVRRGVRLREARPHPRAGRDAGRPARPPRRAPRRVLAIVACTLEGIATEIRPLQRTEVREAEEPFAAGQKGSSAMPHKRNPITASASAASRAWCAATRVVGFENVALWHERDISHSSAERVVLADSTIALDYMLDSFAWILRRPRRLSRAHARATSSARAG